MLQYRYHLVVFLFFNKKYIEPIQRDVIGVPIYFLRDKTHVTPLEYATFGFRRCVNCLSPSLS